MLICIIFGIRSLVPRYRQIGAAAESIHGDKFYTRRDMDALKAFTVIKRSSLNFCD